MSEWDYDYEIGGIPILNYGTSVRIPEEIRARKRGTNAVIPWQHGERSTQPKLYFPLDFPVEILLRYTNAAGAVVHADGAPGHVYENYLALKRLFSGDQISGSLVTLARTLPHAGDVEIDVEVIDEVRPSSDARFRVVFLCRAPFPFWRAAVPSSFTDTYTTASDTLAVVVGGNEPVPNAVITIEAGAQPVTNARVTHTPTGRFLQYSATLDAGESVVIDVGARTIVHSVDGPVDAALLKGYADWFVLPIGSYNLAVTATAGTLDFDVTVAFSNLWS